MRQIIDFLVEAGAEAPHVENGGKHPRIVFGWRGVERRYVVAGTLGDTIRGPKNAISDLRHMLGLVDGEKRVGERRPRRRPAPKIVRAQLTAVAAATPDDWRDSLALHPATQATLRTRLDAAWWVFWRQIHGPRFVVRAPVPAPREAHPGFGRDVAGAPIWAPQFGIR
jgi:hypothetical protein